MQRWHYHWRIVPRAIPEAPMPRYYTRLKATLEDTNARAEWFHQNHNNSRKRRAEAPPDDNPQSVVVPPPQSVVVPPPPPPPTNAAFPNTQNRDRAIRRILQVMQARVAFARSGTMEDFAHLARLVVASERVRIRGGNSIRTRLCDAANLVPYVAAFRTILHGSPLWRDFVAPCLRCQQPPASLAAARARYRLFGTVLPVCVACADALASDGEAVPFLPRPQPVPVPPLIYDHNLHACFAQERDALWLAEQLPRDALDDAECLVPYERNVGPVDSASPLWTYYTAPCTRCGAVIDDARCRLLGTPLVVCRKCYCDVGDKWLGLMGLDRV